MITPQPIWLAPTEEGTVIVCYSTALRTMSMCLLHRGRWLIGERVEWVSGLAHPAWWVDKTEYIRHYTEYDTYGHWYGRLTK
jgi:hypothetical protein